MTATLYGAPTCCGEYLLLLTHRCHSISERSLRPGYDQVLYTFTEFNPGADPLG